jgi:hypothetical protein
MTTDALLYFYSALAQVEIVLLGFWWAVVTFKYDTWVRDATRRRVAYFVSLQFLLPAVMSLVSILAIDTTAVWRVSFALGGLAGAASTLALVGAAAPLRRAGPLPLHFVAWNALAVLYVGIIAVAAFAPSLSDGVGLDALDFEAILTSLLVLLSFQCAWSLFMEAEREHTA